MLFHLRLSSSTPSQQAQRAAPPLTRAPLPQGSLPEVAAAGRRATAAAVDGATTINRHQQRQAIWVRFSRCRIARPHLAMFLRQARPNISSFGRRFSSNSRVDATIVELNKEMEITFGTPPASGNISSQAVQEPEILSPISIQSEQGLTHVSISGEARMVDVSAKKESKRVAKASCKVLLGQKVFQLVAANQIAKGDVLNVAKIAGISGAKQTSNLIPLCHNINLTHVNVDLNLNEDDFSVDIEGEAATTGKTGVEMEAMTAVAVAGLTIYDMCKAASKNIQVTGIRLESKTGGKSGEWSRKQ